MKKRPDERSGVHWVRWSLIVLAFILTVFSLQSIAIWLPYRWAYQSAANATVWPIIQAGVSLCIILLGIVFWIWRRRRFAIFFGMLGIATLLPCMQMYSGLHAYASQRGVQLNSFKQTMLFRQSLPPQASIVYGRDGRTDLYLSTYLTSLPRKGIVIYIHGGGWTGGSRTENSEFFYWLNERGYDVRSIDYRFARDGYASYKDAPRDVACALTSLDDQPTEKIVLMGDSAGGQLALRTAYGIKNGDIASSCGGTPHIVTGVVAIVPAIDFYELYDDPLLGPTSRMNVVRYLGGTPQSKPEAYKDATIETHVSRNLPPTLIINAANDTLVSPRSGVALAERLRASSNTVEQYTVPYAVHSYWINPGGYQTQISRELIRKFLSK